VWNTLFIGPEFHPVRRRGNRGAIEARDRGFTGKGNWRLLPQFATDLAATNWFNLSVQTNRFSDGTNETICGRPPGSNVFLRMQSFRN
jgi:hypothetical protein